MADAQTMLERHVAFEMRRWRGEDVVDVLAEELDALFAWLGTVTVADLGTPEDVAGIAASAVEGLPITDELLALVGAVVATGHQALGEYDDVLGDVVRRQDFDALTRVLSEAEGVRAEVLDILTASEAYSRLVAHVLYNGVKSFVLTQNVLARKIPGASSLVRLGQRGLNSAAPGLEATLDRQLTAFVVANIAETLRDSRRYLEAELDGDLLREMGADAWEALSGRTLASLTGAARPADTQEVAEGAGRVLRSIRDSGVLRRVVGDVARSLAQRHAERPVADVLVDGGITPELLAREVAAAVGPLLARALADGYLEERIRARLEPFYDSLEPTDVLQRSE